MARSWLALLLILLGVGLRVWATGHARFTEEESLFWATAQDIAAGRAFPRYGPSLTGSAAFHPGPLFYYLMALPQALADDPRAGGIFVAALHGGAAALMYSAFSRVAGAAAGLFGLALWAFAPWDALYADRIWLSCVAPVGGTLVLYAAIRASGSTAWQGVLLGAAVVLPQLHMSAPIVWAGAAAWLWLSPPERWSRRAMVVGLAAGLATYLPTALFEVAHGFENTRAILDNAGGKAGPMTLVNSPLRVLGNAVLASTGEISYHFERGYWRPFIERDVYLMPSGWWRWLRFHGPVFSASTLGSVALAFAGWFFTVRGALGRARAAMGAGAGVRGLRGLDAPDRLTLALLVALGAAIGLLIASRKAFYPHYTNLLTPFVLWPVAAWWAQRWQGGLQKSTAAFAAVVAVAMLSATVRYYRSVDALNGLSVTERLVARVLEEKSPVAVRFTGFDNTAAWQNLAARYSGARLELRADAPVRFTVRNHAPHTGAVPPNGEVVGPVLLVREHTGRPSDP